MMFATSASAMEFMNYQGIWVSSRCNGIDGSWWEYPMQWAIPVGMACHTPAGVPGVARG